MNWEVSSQGVLVFPLALAAWDKIVLFEHRLEKKKGENKWLNTIRSQPLFCSPPIPFHSVLYRTNQERRYIARISVCAESLTFLTPGGG